ncbi:Ribonuclease H-like domain containing protein [Naviculisporaceae sp. PSN 640]
MSIDLTSLTPEEPGCSERKKHGLHGHHLGGRLASPFNEEKLANFFPTPEYASNGIYDGFEVPNPVLFFNHVRCPHSVGPPCVCGRYECHTDSLVIAVDGACPGNGTGTTERSAVGVYFGDFGEEELGKYATPNLSLRIPDHPHYDHTNQRAELHSAIAGLTSSKKFVRCGHQWDCDINDPSHSEQRCRVQHVVNKSDSTYLVNSVVQDLPRWLRNGWKTSRGLPVANRDLWEWIVAEIRHLQELNTSVSFWRVPRSDNVEADGLANRGLSKKFDKEILSWPEEIENWKQEGWYTAAIELGPPGMARQPACMWAQIWKYHNHATKNAAYVARHGMPMRSA